MRGDMVPDWLPLTMPLRLLCQLRQQGLLQRQHLHRCALHLIAAMLLWCPASCELPGGLQIVVSAAYVCARRARPDSFCALHLTAAMRLWCQASCGLCASCQECCIG